MKLNVLPVLAVAASLLGGLAWGGAAYAGEMQKITAHDDTAAETYVQTLANDVMGVLKSSESEQAKEQKIRAMIDSDLDGVAIAKYTLGAIWKQATPSEFDEFVRLLKEYASSFYQGRLNEYSGARVTVTGSINHGSKAAVVGSIIDRVKNNEPIQIDWLVIRSGGSYKLLDFEFEGIWLAKSWGDQFASIITQNGGKFQALNDHLKQQLASGKHDIH